MRTITVAGCRNVVRLGLSVACSTVLLVLCVPAIVAADTEISDQGSEAGQTLRPAGLAVDFDDDLLYVADVENFRVSVFDASSGAFVRAFGWGVADGVSEELQSCTTTCFKGLKGSGSGQLSKSAGIAVDNDPTSPGYHDVYVIERENHRVQRFTPGGEFVWMVGKEVNETTTGDLCTAASGNDCGAGAGGSEEGAFGTPLYGGGVAVGPEGTIYVQDSVGSGTGAETRVQKYAPTGAYLEQLLMPVAGGSGFATATGVDSAGNMYLGTPGAAGAVRKYSPTGTPLATLSPSFNIRALTVDPDDHIFVFDGTNTPTGRSEPLFESLPTAAIIEYDPAGTKVRSFYSDRTRNLLGLARAEGASGVLASQEGGAVPSALLMVPFPPSGPVIATWPRANEATDIGNDRATLRPFIDPQDDATTYHLDYISDNDFQEAGETFGPGTISTPETPLSEAEQFKLNAVIEPLTDLFPETLYHWRVVATSTAGGPIEGPAYTFETKEPLELGASWAASVGTDRATLAAEVDPLGLPATGRFEYVEEATFEESGFTEAEVAPAAGSDPLDFGEGEGMEERTAQLFSLTPDTDYRYRIVAYNRCEPEPAPLCDFPGPPQSFKTFAPPAGKILGCSNDAYRYGAGAYLADCRGYEMVSPVAKNGSSVESIDDNTGFRASLDQAAVDGNSITYTTYKAFGPVASSPYVSQYMGRRSSTGWTTEAISPFREGPSILTYVSANLDRQYKYFGEDLCDGWVVQDARPVLAEEAIPDYPGLYRRDNCGAGVGDLNAISRVEPPVSDPGLEPRQFNPEIQGASEDGSVSYFQVKANLTAAAPPQPANCNESVSCQPRLYEAREGKVKLACILPNDTPFAGSCGAGTQATSGERRGTVDRAVSADGSRVFWTDTNMGAGRLFVRIDGAETIQITTEPAEFWTASVDGTKVVYSIGEDLYEYDIETDTEEPIAGEFTGIAGASEDASRIYLASKEDRDAGAEPGEPNLYLYEAGSGFDFVATLEEAYALPTTSPVDDSPILRLSRVTPDGEQIAFMWGGSLTGYDNADVVSGEPDQQVYLYDSTAGGGAGALLCVSCNPTDARPAGAKLDRKPLDNVWAAAWFPSWQSQLGAQRILSDDGTRLSFNSIDALTPRDSNGRQDVYQWEAPGTGDCDSGDASFGDRAGGCVTLVSSGQSTAGSEIVGVSADGDDVFFRTEESLVAQDQGLVDIYDARVGGGFAKPATPPVECQGEACQIPTPAPPTPAPSSVNVAPGNPQYKPTRGARKCPKGKRKIKRKGKVRCVKKKPKHRKSNRHNRINASKRVGR